MASGVYPIRAPEEERAKWQAAADEAKLSFNAWARKSLNEQVDLERALSRLDEPKPVVLPRARDFSFRPDPKPTSKKRGRT